MGIQDPEDLARIGLPILENLLACKNFSGLGSACRIPDHGREISDQENDLMAQRLELAHLLKENDMSEVQIGCGRVKAGFDDERSFLAAGTPEFFDQVLFEDGFDGSSL